MGVQLYYGDLRQRPHERHQLDELIGAVKKGMLDRDSYIFYPVETQNGDIDCVIVMERGIVAIDLKNYTGIIKGEESGPWRVVSPDGTEVTMHNNLYRQLKDHRINIIDFLKRFRIRFGLFNRIDSLEMRKIASWGYFNRGSQYDLNQLKADDESRIAPWFKIVTADTICEALMDVDLDYLLKHREIRDLAMRLHLKRDDSHSDPMPADPDDPKNPGRGGVVDKHSPVAPEEKPVEKKLEPPQIEPPKEDEGYEEPASVEEIKRATDAPGDVGPMTMDVLGEEEEPSEEALSALKTLNVLASYGHAPLYKCSSFGIGYEKKLDLLEKRYLQKSLQHGESAEKFIVGEFGSGKTHFISQLLERAKARGYATALVKLDVHADMLSYKFILSSVCNEIMAPQSQEKGVENLLAEIYKDVLDRSTKMVGGDQNQANELVDRWMSTLKGKRFEHPLYSSVMYAAFNAYRAGDTEKYQRAIQWLSGTISDARIAAEFGVSRYTGAIVEHESRNILLSLYQFIKYSGVKGTVVAFDETDQNWRKITPKHRQLFNSLLQSEVNTLVDTKSVSVMIVYALVPELYDNMMQYPALQNRLQPVNPKYTFDRGYAECPIIVVSRPSDLSSDQIRQELVEIGKKIIDLLYQVPGEHQQRPIGDLYGVIEKVAGLVVQEDLSSSNRRSMVKWAALIARRYYYDGILEDPSNLKDEVKKEDEEEE